MNARHSLPLKHRMAYYLVKHQERAGHAPTSPTEARDNADGGFSPAGWKVRIFAAKCGKVFPRKDSGVQRREARRGRGSTDVAGR